jgi:branched-chain amino acid transport system permease protein
MLLWFGPISYSFDSPYSNQVIRLGGTFITRQNVIIIAVSTLTIALLYAFMKFTFLGSSARSRTGSRDCGL